MSNEDIALTSSQDFTIKLVEVTDAKFSVNPCATRQSIVLTVTAIETVKVLQPQYYYSGDLYSGEV